MIGKDDVAILDGKELLQLAIGKYQLQFNFSENVTLSVESLATLYSSTAESRNWDYGIPTSASPLLALVGRTIVSAHVVGSYCDLVIEFGGDLRLVVSGVTLIGEAYQISSPGKLAVR